MDTHMTIIDSPVELDALSTLSLFDGKPDERFDRITRLAKRVFNVPVAKVTLAAPEVVYTISPAAAFREEVPREFSFCSYAILSDDILVVPDTQADFRFADSPFVVGEPHVRFYAGCPLTVMNGRRLGTLCLLDTRPREMGSEDLGLLKDLAATVEHEMSAMYMAIIDEMTGLANRRGFEVLAQNALDSLRRRGRPSSLLFFDLNGFKAINDIFGHAEGDRALRSFTNLLKQAFRRHDISGRLGGDEFAAFLSDILPSEVATAIKRLRELVSAHNAREQRGYDICFSVGQVHHDGEDSTCIREMLADGDAKMYSDKRSIKALPASG